MGVGMAEFLEKKVGSMKEWDLVRQRLALTLWKPSRSQDLDR